jgi:DNA-binding CsgD family transcriptional regulator
MIAGHEAPCPKCGAPTGGACHSASGRGVPPHKERLDLAGTPHRSKGKSACQKWLEDHAGYDRDDCLIWPFSDTRGYGHFKCNGVRFYAHRYMCTLIHGEPPSDKHQASHSCGKGHEKCVHPRHISWKTPSGNQLDRRFHGTTKRNKYGPMGRITIAQAEEMRRLSLHKTQDELAGMFDTSRGNVQFILNGQTKRTGQTPS